MGAKKWQAVFGFGKRPAPRERWINIQLWPQRLYFARQPLSFLFDPRIATLGKVFIIIVTTYKQAAIAGSS